MQAPMSKIVPTDVSSLQIFLVNWPNFV